MLITILNEKLNKNMKNIDIKAFFFIKSLEDKVIIVLK